MEAALVSAATGALKPVIGKLATLLGDQYKRFKGVRKDIKSLTYELAAMEAFLLKMSEEEVPDVQDKVWMNEVRELSYDMEDCIDDFMKCVDDIELKPDSFMEKIKYSLGKMKARRRIGNEIEDLKKQIKDVGERNERYKTRQSFSNTKNAIVDHRALAIFEHASNLVGVDKPKCEIIKLLNEEDRIASMQEKPKMVSIVGSGGMGKTTLANQVYQDLKGNFECRAFVSVSRNPDMMNILRTILSEVNLKGYAHTEAGSVQQLISNITCFLANKRYFVVIDDVWDVDTWDVIKHAFPITNPGSILITTTRINDVAESCRSTFNGDIYRIRPLNLVHSRELFHRRLLYSNEDLPSHLEKVSDEILKKCDGLPLAIIAICGLLANKGRREDLWNQVKDSIGRALERNPGIERMMEILSLSYFDLPHHLKTCLLYLSIFPEDSIIEKGCLIRRWVAEGFIHAEGRYTIYEIGEMCFNELLNRSLIQHVKSNKYGKVKSCRIHDTILDFIISKSVEENFVTLAGVPNITVGTKGRIRRLSFQFDNQGISTPPKGLVLSHVRSLTVFRNSLEIPSLCEYRCLRVLHFKGCEHLKNHRLADIGRLFQLRYLNLVMTKISELPEQIGHVRSLEMLDLRGTRVRELPSSIVNLEKLVHLFIDEFVQFPDGVEKMKALEILKRVSIFKQPFNFPQKLASLHNLKKLVLDFEGDSATGDTMGVEEDCKKATPSSLRNLGTQNLHSLTIWKGSNFLRQEPLCPMPFMIQKLITYRSYIPHVPKWMSCLVNLQQLRLEVKAVGHDDLCILGALPNLLILDIYGITKFEDRSLIISGEMGFQCLTKFHYFIPNEGMDPLFAAGSMPSLQILVITFDAGKTLSLTTSGSVFDIGIRNLPRLVTLKCKAFGWRTRGAIEAAEAALESAARTHPNHPIVLFNDAWSM